MQIVNVDIKKLKNYEKNPRKNEGAVSAVAESIKNFGFKVPCVIDKNNVIICGHTRVKAAKKLGLETVPCVVADDLTPEQVKAFRLADNKTAELAEWDFNLLDLEISELQDFDMSIFGFETMKYDENEFGENFSLPDGCKNQIVQMAFTLHEKQAELIKNAINAVKNEIKETFGNQNKNGNAIYEVVRQWAELKK